MRVFQRAPAALALALALLCSAGVAAAARPGKAARAAGVAWTKPWYCHDLDCPHFKSVKNLTDLGLELRHYDSAKWVSTSVESKSYDSSVATGFWRLFKYISGNNKEGVKVEMAAPVTVGVRVLAGQGPACKDQFTVSFFIPDAHQDAPPTPSDDAVFIETRPALDVYVTSFGGWAKGSTYLSKAQEASKALEGAGLAIDDKFFFTAGYDSPFRLTGRHNEVWLPAAADPPTRAAAV